MEWNINVTCKRCNRTASKFVKVKYGQNTTIVGCKECGLNTTVELREHTTIVGDLKIVVWYPYYDS